MFSRPVDTLYPIQTDYGEKDRRFQWSIDPDNGLWIPIRDAQGFGQHRGIDFDCPVGSVVRAMADGLIIRTRYERLLEPEVGAGLYILQLVNLPGHDSWVLRYSHLKAVYVEPGQFVARYTPLAESGKTGAIETPLLHVDLVDLRRQWRQIPLKTE